jgi:hypothetical protein
VGDAARQLAHGFHLLEERLASLSQFAFGVLPVRNVPSDLGETDQLTSIVANGVDHYVRPEAATVLAQAPAFRLPTTFGRRLLQGFAGDARLPLLLGIETREVVPEDLVAYNP